MPLGLHLRSIVAAQRGALFGWIPVCLAIGVACYFSLTWEPEQILLLGLGVSAVCGLLALYLLGETTRPFGLAICLVIIGFCLAGLRAHSVAGPVLGWRYYGPIEGRVIAIDKSQSDALRLTLDDVRLGRISKPRTPERVRVSLHGDRSADVTVTPGLVVMTTGHLSPPNGPIEPGGFDFQRHAWFARLGAVGYSRTPLLGVKAAKEGQVGLFIFRVRMAASARIQASLPGDIGGFAAAITTGDRSAISQDALFDLRASNLAHLLAISGLHMGLLSAVVFGALRAGFAMVPFIALRWPTRSLAAAGALIAAVGYLALSGGNVATERAFVMVAVALCALMINRRAISIRAVAIAGIIVLALRPEALLGPGFQMSFAATLALVAVFGWIRDSDVYLGPTWLRPVVAVVISSLVAGLATAPIAAAHFNVIAHYGLIANLLSVPLMGVLVIPSAVVAAVLAPFGLEWIGLWPMGQGLRWILLVADTVAQTKGARGFVVGPHPAVIPLISMGFLTLVLWQGRLRYAGLMAMAMGFILWQNAERPMMLIADQGALVGLMTQDGRALSKPKGAGFVAHNWLENDGDASDQDRAAGRWQAAQFGNFNVVHLSGKRAAAKVTSCEIRDVVITSVPWEGTREKGCIVFDVNSFKQTGALALMIQDGTLKIRTARQAVGDRLWTRWPDDEK